MARTVMLSNGHLHVGLNKYGEVHDFFYPYVGLENHSAASNLRHRIGVWVGGEFSWLDDKMWNITCGFHHGVMVGHLQATNERLGVRLESDDVVLHNQNVFMRSFHIYNLFPEEREIRTFFQQAFIIADSRLSDTCQYLPHHDAIMHYKGRRVFVAGGKHPDGRTIDDYSLGMFGIEGHEGTFRDAEDGVLERNTVEFGTVDSVLAFHDIIKPHDSVRVSYWVVCGRSLEEARDMHQYMLESDCEKLLSLTIRASSTWVRQGDKLAKGHGKKNDSERHIYNSLNVIKAHADTHGAVFASLDTSMLNHNRDSYAYCWPRDAAYALWPLIRLGYTEEPLKFFDFAKRVKHSTGYLYHKYRADGGVGSSWHSYKHVNGRLGPPIQTDETAGVLFMAGQFYRQHVSKEFLERYFTSLIEPMANFLVTYTDKEGLPLPSYDLWEMKYLTSTYTTAITYASLLEAADMADAFDKPEAGARWRATAEAMKSRAISTFWSDKTNMFIKGYLDSNDARAIDETIDLSSFYGAFMFGLLPLDHPQMKLAAETICATLQSDQVKGAFIRFEHDDYYRDYGTQVSNPWPVVSLWMAQYGLETGNDALVKDVEKWITDLFAVSPMLSEQYEPFGNAPLSVEPLVWSHAEYLNFMLDKVTPPDTGHS